jgi:alkanesulfonate monooxygenase SsuD/methylene tetrahydromethanopterin reductase-like flavin-dependent oxidoreductase (luciferase family)
MIIGVNLPNCSSLGHRDAIIAIAQTAEALGYASLWTNDHVLLPTSLPEPFGHVLESLTTLSFSRPVPTTTFCASSRDSQTK